MKEIFHSNLRNSRSLTDLIAERVHVHSSAERSATNLKAHRFTDFTNRVAEIAGSKGNTGYLWLTINPKVPTDYNKFNDWVVPFLEEWTEWAVYCYEVRKDDYTGLHLHALAKIKPSKITTNFARIKLCAVRAGMTGSALHTNYKFVTEGDFDLCMSYLQKQTVTKKKKASNDATIAWRAELGLPLLFNTGDIPTCLSPDNYLIEN